LDYTGRVYSESIPGHYVVYWELKMLTNKGGQENTMVDKETDACCLEMEEAMNFMYRMFRVVDGSVK
jgi:auxin responsive GH3 family protein